MNEHVSTSRKGFDTATLIIRTVRRRDRLDQIQLCSYERTSSYICDFVSGSPNMFADFWRDLPLQTAEVSSA
jgi:hypothetical protein